MSLRHPLVLLLFAFLTTPSITRAADAPATLPFTRQQDIVYGRKFGTALTLDVFTPTAPANGAAVIVVVSGGWYSSHEAVEGVSKLFIAPSPRAVTPASPSSMAVSLSSPSPRSSPT